MSDDTIPLDTSTFKKQQFLIETPNGFDVQILGVLLGNKVGCFKVTEIVPPPIYWTMNDLYEVRKEIARIDNTPSIYFLAFMIAILFGFVTATAWRVDSLRSRIAELEKSLDSASATESMEPR